MARKIEVQIVGDANSFLRTMKQSEGAVRRFGRAAFIAAGAAGVGALFAVFHEGVIEIRESQKVLAQTAAVLKSTGGAAGITAKQVSALATELSNLSGIDDELIAAGENVLLSFTQIQNAAGKGNDIFNRATKAVVDFAARTGRDVPQAALVLGKALADPASKLSSLARAGVVFTKEQLSQVKALQKTKGVMAAQKFVLQELEKRYGGAAKAAGSTLGGQLNVLRERFQDLSGEILGIFVPSVTRAVTAFTSFVKQLSARKGFKAKFEFVFSRAGDVVQGLIQQISNKVRATDWGAVFKFIGEQWRRALTEAGKALGRVDFREVGRELSNSLKASLGQVTQFIKSVDWSKVGGAIVSGIVNFLKGVDWVALFKGVVRLQVAALRALADLLIGAGKELGKALLEGLQSAGDAILKFFEGLGIKIALAILKHLDFKVLGHTIIPGVAGLIDDLQKRLDALGASAASVGAVPGDRGPSSATSSESNKFDVTQAKKNAAEARAAAIVAAQAADADTANAEKRKKAAEAAKKAAEAEKKAAQAAHRAAIEARKASQFKTLGLTGAGEQRTPGIVALVRRSDSLKKQVKGTFLDTAKTRKEFAAIAKVLAQGPKKVGRDVRSAIQQMLSDIADALDSKKISQKAGQFTKTTSLNSRKLLAGLDLSAADKRRLSARLSNFNSGGLALAGAQDVGSSGGHFVVESHTTVNLDGQKVANNTTRHQQKTKRRNPRQKRGPNRGD